MKKKILEATRAYKLVTAVVVAVYITMCIQTVVLMTSVYSMGVGMSWVAWYIAGQLLPGLIFATIWFLTRGTRWERLYQASILAIATTFFSSVLTTLLMFAGQYISWTYDSTLLYTVFYSWLPLALQLLIVIALVLWMRKQKTVEQSLAWVLKVLVCAFYAFFLINIIQTTFMVAVQYPDNQNLSSYISSFVGLGVVALFFIVTYLLEKRRKAKYSARSAVAVTTMGMMLIYVVIDVVSLFTSYVMTTWVVAGIVTVCSLLVIFGYRWLYRTLRVLA